MWLAAAHSGAMAKGEGVARAAASVEEEKKGKEGEGSATYLLACWGSDEASRREGLAFNRRRRRGGAVVVRPAVG